MFFFTLYEGYFVTFGEGFHDEQLETRRTKYGFVDDFNDDVDAIHTKRRYGTFNYSF